MAAMLKRYSVYLSIVILCLAICFQLLGTPGTLFDLADSEDDFQASIMVGHTMTSNTPSYFLRVTTFSGFTEIASVPECLRVHNFFHPPLFI